MFRRASHAAAVSFRSSFQPSSVHRPPPQHPQRIKVVGPAKWEPSPQEVSAAYWTLPGWNPDVKCATPGLPGADGHSCTASSFGARGFPCASRGRRAACYIAGPAKPRSISASDSQRCWLIWLGSVPISAVAIRYRSHSTSKDTRPLRTDDGGTGDRRRPRGDVEVPAQTSTASSASMPKRSWSAGTPRPSPRTSRRGQTQRIVLRQTLGHRP